MTTDHNAARKRDVLARAKKSGNAKVLAYVENVLIEKIDQLGPNAGAFLEDLESGWTSHAAFEGFSEDDFEVLHEALFGY